MNIKASSNCYVLMKMKDRFPVGLPAVFWSELEFGEICDNPDVTQTVAKHFYGEHASSYLNPGERWAIVVPHVTFAPISG